MHATVTVTVAAVVLLLLHPPAAASDLTPTNSTDTEFIRTSCATTLFPDLCFTSLANHSAAVGNDAAKLAKVAIKISLTRARQMAAYVANISGHSSDALAAAAVSDCLGNVGDAVDEIRGSLKQMRTLGSGTASLRFQMSNMQTWMSAALTDEETCTDGFEEVTDGPMKAEVFDRIADVKRVTSNALALVNLYAQKVSPP